MYSGIISLKSNEKSQLPIAYQPFIDYLGHIPSIQVIVLYQEVLCTCQIMPIALMHKVVVEYM